MPMQVLVNLLIGFLWMFLQDDWSFLTFFTGYIFGLLVIFIFCRFLTTKFYLFTLYAVIRLFFLLVHEVFTSSIMIIREIVKPKIDIKPGIVATKTDLESDFEVTLLAMLITFTPGSTVMEISPDKKVLYFHTMDIPEIRDAVLQSQAKFEKAIKRVTRP